MTGELLEQGIPAALRAAAQAHPDRPAIIGPDGVGTYGTLTFARLDDLSGRLARRLRDDYGILAGSRVAWSYGNPDALIVFVLYHAVAKAGGVNVPVSPALAPAEAARILDAAHPQLVVTPSSRRDLAAGRVGLVVDTPAELDHLIDGASLLEPAEGNPSDEDAIILFTSGTTGRSKGVVHTHRSSLHAGNGWNNAFSLQSSDVYQSMFPIYSGAGLHFSGLACLLSGSTYVVEVPRPTADSLRRVETYRSTVYAAVPSIYEYWLAEELSAFDLSSLRLLDFGGSVMHAATIAALRSALPAVELVQTYGLTEAGPGGLYLPAGELDAHLGAIGTRATDDLEFRLDESAGVGHVSDRGGRVGELQFRGSSLMRGYLDDLEATAAVFDDGWLRSGDLVRVDDDGAVYFVDRIKDLIIRGGFNISSSEIEDVFATHPSVRHVAAFGHPHRALGEVVAVALVLDTPDSDLDALRSFVAGRLSRQELPEYVVLLDELPLSPAGKVLKARLRAHPGLRPWGPTT